MVHKFFGKKSSGSGVATSSFRDNVWGPGLADMQLLSKFNKGFRFFYVLLIFLVNMLGLFL